MNNFAKNFKRLRIENNLSQIQLAQKLNITQRKISYWESGNIEPDLDMLILISQIFEITLDELIKERY
jgi:transcriptional regulator with XRE-family HTH domain